MLTFNTGAIYQNRIYSITNFENFPIVFDLEKEEISYIHNIKDYDCGMMSVGVDEAFGIGNEVYFFSLRGDVVAVYNIVSNSYEKISIDCHVQDWGNYAAITNVDEYIFLFPSYGEKVVKINTKTHEVLYEESLYRALDKKRDDKIFKCGCCVDKTMWLFGNKVVAYDLIAQKYRSYDLPKCMEECINAVYSHGCFVLLDKYGQVIKWNIKEHQVKRLLEKQEAELPFVRMISTKWKLWILPALGEDILIIDCETESVSKYQDYPGNYRYNEIAGWSKFYGYCEDDKKYYLAMRTSNYMLCIDKVTGKESWIKPKTPDNKEKLLVCKTNRYLMQEEFFSLEEFLDGMQ